MPAQPPLYRRALFQQVAGRAWRPGGTALTRHALDLCALPVGARVLDVGCGAGASLELLLEAGLRPVGLDIVCAVPPALRASVVLGQGAALPFAAGSMDALLCECTLCLLGDTALALQAFAQCLPLKGHFVLCDMFLLAGKGAGAASGALDGQGAHCSCLQGARPRAELEALLAQAGFALLHFEDHTPRLRAMAAQLLWRGLSMAELLAQAGLPLAQGCTGQAEGRRYGYGLWHCIKAAPLPFA
jgi:arsenite methyltransferase